jgi:hypothetical protein
MPVLTERLEGSLLVAGLEAAARIGVSDVGFVSYPFEVLGTVVGPHSISVIRLLAIRTGTRKCDQDNPMNPNRRTLPTKAYDEIALLGHSWSENVAIDSVSDRTRV